MAKKPSGRLSVRPCLPPDPRAPARWHKLFVVPRTGEHRVIALADSVTWVWRHFCPNRKRFELCLAELGQHCVFCAHHFGREQTGYLPVLRGPEQVTMTMTSGAWNHSPSLRAGDGKLRGYTVVALRLHPRANGPLRCWLPGDHTDPRRLPQPWDVIVELDVRFGLASRDDDQAEDEQERPAI